MSLRRGFKTRANQISVRLRKGQGRSPEDPIDLGIIAERLSIEIVPLSMLKGDCQAAVRRLSITDNGSFSAATLPVNAAGISSFTMTATIPAVSAGTLRMSWPASCSDTLLPTPSTHRDAEMWTATLRTKRAGLVPQFLFPTKRPCTSCDKGSMMIRPAKCMA